MAMAMLMVLVPPVASSMICSMGMEGAQDLQPFDAPVVLLDGFVQVCGEFLPKLGIRFLGDGDDEGSVGVHALAFGEEPDGKIGVPVDVEAVRGIEEDRQARKQGVPGGRGELREGRTGRARQVLL